MLVLNNQVEFFIGVRDITNTVQPQLELFTFATDLVTSLHIAITIVAVLRLLFSIYVTAKYWLVDDWQRDWQMIREATVLLFYPREGYHGTIWAT